LCRSLCILALLVDLICSHTTIYAILQLVECISEATKYRGFKSMKTAYATIKEFELMHMFRKGQMDVWKNDQGLIGEIRLIERQFNIYSA